MRVSIHAIQRAVLCAATVFLGLSVSADDSSTEGDSSTLEKRFEREIWPILTREVPRANGGAAMSCVDCHDAEHSSDLHFFETPRASYRALVSGGYFGDDDRDAIVARVASPRRNRRMPPPRKYEALEAGKSSG